MRSVDCMLQARNFRLSVRGVGCLDRVSPTTTTSLMVLLHNRPVSVWCTAGDLSVSSHWENHGREDDGEIDGKAYPTDTRKIGSPSFENGTPKLGPAFGY